MANKGITANQITVLSIVLSIAAGALLYWQSHARWPFLLLPVVLFIRMALNAIDGILAREFQMSSKLGAVLNELGDVLSDTALYSPFAVVPGLPSYLIVAVVIFSVIAEMTGVVAVQIGAGRRYEGPMGKSDRAFVFGAIALLLGCGVPKGIWLSVIFGLVLILSIDRKSVV